MVLPDGVLAYRVLNSAILSNEQITLCCVTMTDLKYDEMVKQLKQLIADAITSAPECAQSTQVVTKEEPVFFMNNNTDQCIPAIPDEGQVIEAIEVGEEAISINKEEEEVITRVL